MTDLNEKYLRGIGDLLQAIERTDADYLTVLTLQGRLAQAISETRQYGPTDNARAEITRVTTELDRVCLAHLGKSFRSLCGIDKLLEAGPPKIYHNLPQPDYGHFVGREQELAKMYELLSPTNRHFLVTVDGIGGIGKSALALEVAHHYLRDAAALPDPERFEAIIWTSAKQFVLTAEGVVQRKQVLRTLNDIYTTISITLEREDITRARAKEQPELVRRALTQQRTLLIVDNLETVDEEVVTFLLQDLPVPTKAIVTSRHRIDAAYPVRLAGMPWNDARLFIKQECQKKNVALTGQQRLKLYNRTGGVPLALVWSIAQMGFGQGADTVLYRLEQPGGDVARFCFKESIKQIRNTEAHKLLVILALFATSAGREALSYIGGFDQDVITRDVALTTLERLSLANRRSDGRFEMLPLSKVYTLADPSLDLVTSIQFRKRQIEYYLNYFQRPSPSSPYPRELVSQVNNELDNILDLLEWCQAQQDQGSLLELFLRVQDFLGVFGRLNLRVAWGEHAIRAAKAVGSLADLGRLYAVTMGWAAIKRGELDEAQDWLNKGLEIIRQSGDQKLEGVTLRFLGRLKMAKEQPEQALQIYEDTLAMAKVKGFEGLIARLNSDLAYWEMQYGTLDKAESYIRESIGGFEALNDSVRASDRSIMLANILVR